MYQRINQHWLSHRHNYVSVLATLILIIVGSLTNMYLIRSHLSKAFNRTFETFSYEGLQTYQSGNVSLVKNLLSDNAQKIQNISVNTIFSSALTSKNYTAAQTELDELKSLTEEFNTYLMTDNKGIVRVISSDLPNISRFIGSDFSTISYIKKVIDTKKSFTGDVYAAKTGRLIIATAIPITDNSGNLLGIMIGNTTLDQITKLLKPEPVNGYYFSVTDNLGNLIIDKNAAPDAIKNISQDERLMSGLQNTDTVTAQETNYLGAEAFAIGSKVQLAKSNTSVNVISYYDKSAYSSKLQSIKDESNGFYYNELSIVNAVWVISSGLIILHIHKRYDKV